MVVLDMSRQGKEAQAAFVLPRIPTTAVFSKLIMFQYFNVECEHFSSCEHFCLPLVMSHDLKCPLQL